MSSSQVSLAPLQFSTLLIANRGEIVARIAKSARALGYRTIAVHSDADRGAAFVAACHEAIAIGGLMPADSYLRIDKIIAAARASGAEAVHPGYGFLSENAEFAEACEAAGLIFIGPPAAAIRIMGDKAGAKRQMLAAGVACIPGYQGEDQSDARLLAEAEALSLPLMIKAAAGGGGRGMRRVTNLAELPAAIASARSEARSAFGDDALILERALTGARHVEVQVLADRHGQVIHLGERDCSVQRRHQKVIEEAPSPAVTPTLRAALGAAACTAARAVHYVGAGTIEFLLDGDGQFYFMEMNTRLQVEHPVTELITGLDLVEWQLRVARGEPLALVQQDLSLHGHAIEVRLYAEDAERGFLPQSGRLLRWRAPSSVRCDHALADGQAVSSYYDPMLAKLIAWGETRAEAARRLVRGLEECVVLGLTTNRSFLIGCLEHPEFAAGRATTDFIAAHFCAESDLAPRTEAIAAGVLLSLARSMQRLPLPALHGWWSSGTPRYDFELDVAGEPISASITAHAGAWLLAVGDDQLEVRQVGLDDDSLTLSVDGIQHRVAYAFEDDHSLHVTVAGRNLRIRARGMDPPTTQHAAGSGQIKPPMNGRVVALSAAPGDRVERGQTLLLLESMKIEQPLVAPMPGLVAEIHCRVGDQVAPTQTLVVITPLTSSTQETST